MSGIFCFLRGSRFLVFFLGRFFSRFGRGFLGKASAPPRHKEEPERRQHAESSQNGSCRSQDFLEGSVGRRRRCVKAWLHQRFRGCTARQARGRQKEEATKITQRRRVRGEAQRRRERMTQRRPDRVPEMLGAGGAGTAPTEARRGTADLFLAEAWEAGFKTEIS